MRAPCRVRCAAGRGVGVEAPWCGRLCRRVMLMGGNVVNGPRLLAVPVRVLCGRVGAQCPPAVWRVAPVLPCVAVGWVACPGWPGWVCLSRCFSPGRVWGGGVAHCWVLREQARPPCPLCGGVGAGGVSLVRVRARGHTAGFLMVLASAVSPWCFRGRVGWGVGFWVGGLVGVGFSWGVCELDSGCEHLGAARRGVASCFLVFVL